MGFTTLRPATLPWNRPAALVNEPVLKSLLLRLATEPVTSFLVVLP